MHVMGALELRDDGDGPEISPLILALEAEGTLWRSSTPPDLAARVFAASAVELRRAEASRTPALRLVGSQPAAAPRVSRWRRLAPYAAMAACFALASVVAIPSMRPVLMPDSPSGDSLFVLAGDESGVTPVVAALLQQSRDPGGTWNGVPMITIDTSMLHPIGPEGASAESRHAAPMAPLLEARQADFSALAEEFERIRAAAETR